MIVTRRTALQMAAATALLPKIGYTQTAVSMGDGQLLTISDGHLTLPADLIFGPSVDMGLAEVVAEYGIDDITAPLQPPCNLTLFTHGDRTILFDAGSGPTFQPTAGGVLDALASAGYGPDDITDVVFTHAHPDHLWGVLDDFDEPVFLNAQHWIGRVERDYWTDPDTVNTIGEARASFAVGAARRLAAIEGVLESFEDEDEFIPGIAAHMTPGHTPGHMAFEISAGGGSALVIGDAIGNHHVALARPHWPAGSDQDQELGAATRARLVERLSGSDMVMVGFHLPEGGIGHIDTHGEGFAFVPAS